MRFSILWAALFSFRQLMRDRKHRADILACHTRNVTDLVDCDCVKLTDKSSGLRTHSHTGTAVNTGVPVEVEYYRRVLFQEE